MRYQADIVLRHRFVNTGDLFSQLRIGLAFNRWSSAEPLNRAGREPTSASTTALEALDWVTVNAADAIGQGHLIGSIAPGKQADIIVVGGPSVRQRPVHDVAATVIYQTHPEDVQHVFVAGRHLKKAGKLIGVDTFSLSQEVDQSARQILDRIGAAGLNLPGGQSRVDDPEAMEVFRRNLTA